jgi:hypothetical protein
MTVPEDPVGDLPPADELDELASARLDGAEPADAVDPAVEAEVARRQARFDRVRAVLAEPVAVDPDARDAAIAAALDAALHAAMATPTAGADDLAARRSARDARRAAGLKVLGAAAAVVAAIALGAAVLAQGDSDDVDAAGDASAEAESSLGGDDSADAPLTDSDVDDGEGAAQARAVLGDLGEFADVEALLDAVDTGAREGVEVPEGADSTVASNAYDFGCAEGEPAADGPAVLLATATLDGTPVAVFSVAGGDVVVVDVETCTVVDPEP